MNGIVQDFMEETVWRKLLTRLIYGSRAWTQNFAILSLLRRWHKRDELLRQFVYFESIPDAISSARVLRRATWGITTQRTTASIIKLTRSNIVYNGSGDGFTTRPRTRRASLVNEVYARREHAQSARSSQRIILY